MFDWAFFIQSFPAIAAAFPATFAVTAAALAVGLAVGLALAWARVRRIPGVAQLAILFISFNRSVPVLVLLYLVYCSWPQLAWVLLQQPPAPTAASDGTAAFIVASSVLGFAYGSYFANIFYSAYLAVGVEQIEAARSVGLSGWSALTRVIAPQATRSALPNFANSLTDLIKDTSVVSTIGVLEMMAKASEVAARGLDFLETYTVVLVIYLVFCAAVTVSLRIAERRLLQRY